MTYTLYKLDTSMNIYTEGIWNSLVYQIALIKGYDISLYEHINIFEDGIPTRRGLVNEPAQYTAVYRRGGIAPEYYNMNNFTTV